MDDMKAVTSDLKAGTYLSDAMLKVYTNWEEEKNRLFFGQMSKMTKSDAKDAEKRCPVLPANFMPFRRSLNKLSYELGLHTKGKTNSYIMILALCHVTEFCYSDISYSIIRIRSLCRIVLSCMMNILVRDYSHGKFEVTTALIQKQEGFHADFKSFCNDSYSHVGIGFFFKASFHVDFPYKSFKDFCTSFISQFPHDLYDILHGMVICSNSYPFDTPQERNIKAEYTFQCPNTIKVDWINHLANISYGTYILLNVSVSTTSVQNDMCSCSLKAVVDSGFSK